MEKSKPHHAAEAVLSSNVANRKWMGSESMSIGSEMMVELQIKAASVNFLSQRDEVM